LELEESMLIIDCDGGWDDAFATSLCLREKKVDLVSVVGGINTLVGGGELMCRILDCMGAPESTKVVLGCNSPEYLAQTYLEGSDWGKTYRNDCNVIGNAIWKDIENARRRLLLGPASAKFVAKTILHLIEANDDKNENLTILCLGPLTNIACLVQIADPIILSRINLVIMGGAVCVHGNTPVADAEFNFNLDPSAAAIVFRCQHISITLVPLDVCCCFQIEPIDPSLLELLQSHARDLITSRAESEENKTENIVKVNIETAAEAEAEEPLSREKACMRIISVLIAYLGAWCYDSVAAFYLLRGIENFNHEDMNLVIDATSGKCDRCIDKLNQIPKVKVLTSLKKEKYGQFVCDVMKYKI
jgi:inosine-uridine nucleoside N-ribohydrolase